MKDQTCHEKNLYPMATTVLSKENNGLIYIYLLTTKYIRYKDEYNKMIWLAEGWGNR